MPDRSAAFDQSVKQELIKKLETVVLAVCRIQQRPALDRPILAIIIASELDRLVALGGMDGRDLEQDTFDRVTLAVSDWHLHGWRE